MIVISNPTAILNEIEIICSLFKEGLELFHIRKPDFSKTEMKAFVLAIGLEYNNKLVLHSQHQMAEELGINRIHFSEKMRTETFDSPARFTKPCRYIKSSSTHSIKEFNNLSDAFDYAFLSPVFKSISKENYQSDMDFSVELKKRTQFKTKLVALGGIQATNLQQALTMGFDDVALLGSIWKTENPIKEFKKCQKIVHSL